MSLTAGAWAASDYYDVLGHGVLVRTTSPGFGRVVRRLLRSFPGRSSQGRDPEVVFSIVVAPSANGGPPQDSHHFYRDDELIRQVSSTWKLMRILEWQLDAFVVQNESDHALFHAGSVAIGGAGIILPGSSRSGKSSLTMGLLLQGCSYLSDELTAVSRTTGELVPFPKPLSCRDTSIFPSMAGRQDVWFGPEASGSHGKAPQANARSSVWFAHPEDVRDESVGGSARIKHLIFPEHTPNREPRIREISKGETMRRLIRHAVNFSQLEGQGLHMFAEIVDKSKAYSLSSNGFPDTAELVLEVTGAQLIKA